MKICYMMLDGQAPEWEKGLLAELTQVGYCRAFLATRNKKGWGFDKEVVDGEVILVSANAALDLIELLRTMAPKRPIVILLDNHDDVDELLAMFKSGVTMFVDILANQDVFHAQLRALGDLARPRKPPAPKKPTRTVLPLDRAVPSSFAAAESHGQEHAPPKVWKQPKSYGFSTPDRHEGDEDGAPQPDV